MSVLSSYSGVYYTYCIVGFLIPFISPLKSSYINHIAIQSNSSLLQNKVAINILQLAKVKYLMTNLAMLGSFFILRYIGVNIFIFFISSMLIGASFFDIAINLNRNYS